MWEKKVVLRRYIPSQGKWRVSLNGNIQSILIGADVMKVTEPVVGHNQELKYPAGQICKIYGLEKQTKYNGMLVRLTRYSLEKERWEVTHKEEKLPIWIKVQNLEPMALQEINDYDEYDLFAM